MTTGQPIRRSQFITTYGPGAILEGAEGPRIIPTLERSGIFRERRTTEFEITDQRLSQALLAGSGILRLPTNSEVGKGDLQPIYSTDRFPTWSSCVRHGLLYRKRNNDNRACPKCVSLSNSSAAWRQSNHDAVRFVSACPDGHLDDVNWEQMITHATTPCNPLFLEWRGGGGAMRHINIVCPNCQGTINLGQAYSREWPCSGRFAEHGSLRPGCISRSKIIQRGAANLRIAELQSALTIPPRSTRLHRLLEMSVVQSTLINSVVSSKAELLESLGNLLSRGLLLKAVVDEIQTYQEADILAAIGDTLTGSGPATEQQFRIDEFEALKNAAEKGAPAQPSHTPGGPPQFEVILQNVRVLRMNSGRSLRITPMNRLRVVMVQTGYRRLDPLNNVVNLDFDDGQRRWHPGVELFGEGVFVDLAPVNGTTLPLTTLHGQAATEWFDAWISAKESNEQQFGNIGAAGLHPAFVWWHTLAHRLMNGLAIDSGYSSAAVRERVFVDIDDQSGDAKGGVLLYTAQPGGDGTLGGLIALVPQFEHVLEAALRDLDACSNDPLCGEENFTTGKYNGAACYSCALVSETSCEHQNMRLDRNLLLENMP